MVIASGGVPRYARLPAFEAISIGRCHRAASGARGYAVADGPDLAGARLEPYTRSREKHGWASVDAGAHSAFEFDAMSSLGLAMPNIRIGPSRGLS